MEVLQLECLSPHLIQWNIVLKQVESYKDIPNHPLDASFVFLIKCYPKYKKQIPDEIIGNLTWLIAYYNGIQVKRKKLR